MAEDDRVPEPPGPGRASPRRGAAPVAYDTAAWPNPGPDRASGSGRLNDSGSPYGSGTPYPAPNPRRVT
ncbi:hypothetical protein SUDANB178_02752 [Streptomyces sp. enrichment culture]